MAGATMTEKRKAASVFGGECDSKVYLESVRLRDNPEIVDSSTQG